MSSIPRLFQLELAKVLGQMSLPAARELGAELEAAPVETGADLARAVVRVAARDPKVQQFVAEVREDLADVRARTERRW